MDVLILVMRWAHILAAITAVGGAIYFRFALLPAAGKLDPAERERLLESVRAAWLVPLHAAVALLLVSGLFNIAMIEMRSRPADPYHMLFGIKFLLALVIFFISIRLVGRSDAARRFRERARLWLNVNLALAVILVCISGALGKIDKPPRPAAADAAEAAPAGELSR